jgi:hypothetical protein
MRTFTAQLSVIVVMLASLCALADSAHAGPFRNRGGVYYNEYPTAYSGCESAMYYPTATGRFGSTMNFATPGYYANPGYAYGPPGNYRPTSDGQTTSLYSPPYTSGAMGGLVPNRMPARDPVQIRFLDDSLDAASITIAPGTIVRWINESRQPQTITSVNGDWDSGDILPGKEYRATFNQTGTFEYSSRFQRNLKGTIVIK